MVNRQKKVKKKERTGGTGLQVEKEIHAWGLKTVAKNWTKGKPCRKNLFEAGKINFKKVNTRVKTWGKKGGAPLENGFPHLTTGEVKPSKLWEKGGKGTKRCQKGKSKGLKCKQKFQKTRKHGEREAKNTTDEGKEQI